MMNTMTLVRSNAPGAAAEAPRTIDLVHLARMTLGDRSLEREVLQLFVRQASQLVERMRNGPADRIGPLAHTLKGSARGIGACRVAAAVEAAELASSGAALGLPAALERLAETVDEAATVITELLRAH